MSVGGDTFTQQDVWRENTLGNVVAAAGSDPPAFHLLLHFWMQAFGTSDLAVRLPSVISGVVLVYVIFRLGLQLFSEPVSWVAASFAAVHPLFVRYSQEARGRMLAMAFASLATLLFARILLPAEPGRRRVALTLGYALCTTLALLTHPMCFGVFLGHAAFASLRVRNRGALTSLIAAWSLAGCCGALWLASAAPRLGYLGRMQTVALERALSGDAGGVSLYPATPRFLAAGLVKLLLSMSGWDIQPTLLSLGWRVRDYAWLAAFPLLLLWAGGRRHRDAGDGRALLGLIVACVATVLVGLALRSGHTMTLRPHYAVFGAPFLVPLLAAGVVELYRRRRVTRAALAPIVTLQAGAIAIGLAEVYRDEILWRRPPNVFAALARQIEAAVQAGDVVVFPTWGDARICNLYLRQSPAIRQRVEQKPGADASILAGYALPNTPERTVAMAEPTLEPIRVLAPDGRERARLAHPRYW